MVRKYLKLAIATIFVAGSVFLFMEGSIYWGVLADFIAGLFVLFFFKNEKSLLAFYFLRKNKLAAAETALNGVKHPEAMIKSQEAQYYYLCGLIEIQKNQTKADKLFKKALEKGLRLKTDQAVAKLNLAGIALSRRNKKMAKYYLAETKKLDKQKMLKPQINEIETMLKRI